MQPPPYLLALVSRGTLPAEVDQILAELNDKLKQLLGVDPSLVDSLTWYRENFDRCGNWDSWIWDAVSGRDYETRDYRFRGFVVCKSKSLGRANASIVDLALRNQRTVLYFALDHDIEVVTAIEQTEPEELAAGWTITTQVLRG